MSEIIRAGDLKSSLLADTFTGDVVIPGDADYNASLVRFAKNAQKNAAVIAFVKSADDVSRVIELANTYSSTTNRISVVVRGGGHSTSGSSSSDGGIVIDLSRHLNTVRIDEKLKLGYVGGGATWATVDKEAMKYGLATPGGTINHTGVGGLSLGGGYGWLMGEHGMTIDNILQVTLVTSDGSILTVNSESHPDLYWAIRGGGPNFGCVTEFVFQLHPQRTTVLAGPLIFSPSIFPTLVTVLEEWYRNASEKEAAMVAMTNKGPLGDPAVIAVLFYNGEEEEGRKKFAKFLELGPLVDAMSMVPYERVNELQNAAIPYGANYHMTGTVRGENEVTPQVAAQLFNHLVDISSAPGNCAVDSPPILITIWEYFNLKRAASIPADATAFRMRVPHPVMPILIRWEGDSVEATKDAKERLTRFKQCLEDEIKSTFRDGKGEDDTGYGNYETGNPRAIDSAIELYGANYPRLQGVKQRYDPVMMFGSWYPIQTPNKA